MICSLPTECSNFVLSLLLMNKLDKSTVQQAFHTEETQRYHHSKIEDQGPSDKSLNTMFKTIKDLICAFCNKSGQKYILCYCLIPMCLLLGSFVYFGLILVIWSAQNHLAVPEPFFLFNSHPLTQSWPLVVWALALKSRLMFAPTTPSATPPISTTGDSCTTWTSSTATPSPSSKEVRVFFFRHSFRSDIAPPGCSITLSCLNNDPL